MSVKLRFGDGLVHIADEFPDWGVLAPPSIGGTPIVLALQVADAETAFARAVAAGAEIRQPLQEVFWGDLRVGSRIRSAIAGTSDSTCATCRTTRSWRPPRRPSHER